MRTTNRRRPPGISVVAAARVSLPASPDWANVVGPGVTTENE